MAETRHCPYSFYVPENDEQLVRFVKAQSNLSLSVRMLMKAFIAANKGAMRDAASEDLLDLVQGMALGTAPAAEGTARAAEHKPAAQEKPAEAAKAQEDAQDTAEPGHGHQDEVEAPPAQAGEPAADAAAGSSAGDMNDTAEAAPAAPVQAHEEADEAPIVPEVEEDPEKPMRLVGSERSAYNAANAPQQQASMDDIMDMMGDGM